MYHFPIDAFPMNENFWDVLDEKINKHKDFKKLVGSFGFNDVDRNNRFGRGNLIQNILTIFQVLLLIYHIL